MNVDDLIPANIRALGSYTPDAATPKKDVEYLRLDSNENPFGPSPKATAAIERALRDVNRYPSNGTPQLAAKIAAHYALEPANVLPTGGSVTVLDIVARTLLAPGCNAVTSELSFIAYPVVTSLAGATLKTVPTRNHGFDLDAIADAVDANTRLVFLANPNNPTGTIFDAASTDRFLDRLPNRVVVVLDEAYFEFADYFAKLRGLEYSHAIRYVRDGRNVIVTRTFSKAHGLAGLRVGYGLGPAKLVSYLARVRMAFQVSGIAEAAALAAMDDEEHIRKTLENDATGAQMLSSGLNDLGLSGPQTWANFLYFETPNASDLVRLLLDDGIMVRPLRGWGSPKGIRVTIGTAEQNARFLTSLKRILG